MNCKACRQLACLRRCLFFRIKIC